MSSEDKAFLGMVICIAVIVCVGILCVTFGPKAETQKADHPKSESGAR